MNKKYNKKIHHFSSLFDTKLIIYGILDMLFLKWKINNNIIFG